MLPKQHKKGLEPKTIEEKKALKIAKAMHKSMNPDKKKYKLVARTY